jgi:hypothetical protein
MANINNPFGARTVNSLIAAATTGGVRPYTLPVTDAVDYWVGDFVKPVQNASGGQGDFKDPVIVKAAPGDSLLGFVASFQPLPDFQNYVYRQGSQLRTSQVIVDPNTIFEIQASNGAFLATHVNQTANIAVLAGDPVNGRSRTSLDVATITPAAGQLYILGLVIAPDNDFGEYARVLCTYAKHVNK